MTLIDHWIEKRSVPATMCQRMEQGKKGWRAAVAIENTVAD
jgi:hypothetical protein